MSGVWIGMVTYNEAENLPAAIAGVFSAMPEAHVVVVDDNSPDGTGDIADKMAEQDTRLHIIHREGKLGYASAQRAALDWALAQRAERFATLDADLSHDPAALPSLVAALDDADIAIGSRYVRGGKTVGWPARRRLLSCLGNWAFRWLGGLPARDNTSGFRAYRTEALSQIDLAGIEGKGYTFLTQVLALCRAEGLRITEVPITFTERRHGQSKLSGSIVSEQLRLLGRLMASRLVRPFKRKP